MKKSVCEFEKHLDNQMNFKFTISSVHQTVLLMSI